MRLWLATLDLELLWLSADWLVTMHIADLSPRVTCTGGDGEEEEEEDDDDDGGMDGGWGAARVGGDTLVLPAPYTHMAPRPKAVRPKNFQGSDDIKAGRPSSGITVRSTTCVAGDHSDRLPSPPGYTSTYTAWPYSRSEVRPYPGRVLG